MHEVHSVGGFQLTTHARERARERGIPLEAVEIVLRHGRPVRTERGDTYALGRAPRLPRIPSWLWNKARTVIVVVDAYGSIPTLYAAPRTQGRTRR